jgi:hypothetical protein
MVNLSPAQPVPPFRVAMTALTPGVQPDPDPLDGVERDFVLGIYQHIAVPDIAFVLLGDSSPCAARAASRGRHSRFQATDVEGNRQELAMFHEALAFLRRAGYPAHEHTIGRATADEVADPSPASSLSGRDGRS